MLHSNDYDWVCSLDVIAFPTSSKRGSENYSAWPTVASTLRKKARWYSALVGWSRRFRIDVHWERA